MVSANDQIDSFFKSLHTVKGALSPLESGIRRAVKDIESCWEGPFSGANNHKLFPKLNVAVGNSRQCEDAIVVDDIKKNVLIRFPIKTLLGTFSPNSGANDRRVEVLKKGSKEDSVGNVSCTNSLRFAVTWSLLLNRFVQVFHGRKRFQKQGAQDRYCSDSCKESTSSGAASKPKRREYGQFADSFHKTGTTCKGGDSLSMELRIGLIFYQFTKNFQKFEQDNHQTCHKSFGQAETTLHLPKFDHLGVITGILKVKKADVDYFPGNLRFARLGGAPRSLEGVTSSVKEEGVSAGNRDGNREETESSSPQKLANGLLNIPLSNVELLQSTLSTVSLTELIERLPQLGKSSKDHPDKEKLFSVQDFFMYTQSAGRRNFEELNRDQDGQVTIEDLKVAMRKRRLLQKSEISTSLKNAGLPANEDNAVEYDPRNIWFEDATVASVAPPVEIPAGSVLKSALAGGLSCALSAFLMHPVDTVKTQVQASTLSFPEILSKLPQIGLQGLYRGSIPTVLGQFSSHGLRTGMCEASKLVLVTVAPTLTSIQVESIASFCSTILGTTMRIPCEVLKQRLQAGLFDNVGEAFVGTLHQDGIRGFFRGTGATLCREVPFYVAGMGLYAESKKVVQLLLKRDLEPWETVVVGALSGGLASITTTPFDVIKTRMMITSEGLPVSMSMVAFSILRQEGPLGLFKGVVPRFFWIAPLGAINFAGYEIIRKAMG
ncbi:hypothetical protein NE237_003011 [Protea cynaroides]|uniref:Mitochondrial substrate carrier family protein n=1 Tax=Protea cynaroides TaxID=273540 RepID=A0A9Q0QS66_9MAGN|nr:hypothetical protein NE237_003011 [Protea cynaroides]